MILKNGMIFGENEEFRRGSIVISNGRITEISYGDCECNQPDEDIIDVSDCYVIPGLVDIHFHGCKGYDFCDGTQEAFEAIAHYELRNGVTSMVPATMTLEKAELVRICKAAKEYSHAVGGYSCPTGSVLRGITMEGPFIAAAKKGAQNEAYILKPDIDFFREIQALSGGLIKQVTVAPEEEEAMEFIEAVCRETVVSLAHTAADYNTTKEAFAKGANHVTHLFNAMPPLLHREPGVVGAAYENSEVFVELICDGEHLHPTVVKAMFDLFGAERICMISDSIMATGMKDGNYSLGGQSVTVKGKKATLKEGNLAGSVCNLYDCLKIAVLDMGIPLEEAVLACTKTPARSLGLDGECGSIVKGRTADLVLLDKALNMKTVLLNGEKQF